MAQQQQEEDDDPVVAAIERVLQVERDGAEQLRRGQDQAKELLDQARARAAVIAGRADARISRLYGNYLQKVQRDIEKLAQSAPSAAERLDRAYSGVMLVQAVRRVAAKLTSGA